MADKKVTELTSASSVALADVLYLVQSGTSKKLTVEDLVNAIPRSRFTGNVAFQSEATQSAAGVISAVEAVTKLSTSGSSFTCTMQGGTTDQMKFLVMTATAGGIVTVGSLAGNANVHFSKLGHSATFLYSGNLWYVLGGSANIVLP